MNRIRITLFPLAAALLLAACASGTAHVSVGPTNMVTDGGRHFIGLAVAP
ncbi:MAG: hypothetical protein OEY97_12175 [Nitrospirota bacterium]|nr:hypothetical protein [Nitrospirota bacterium]